MDYNPSQWPSILPLRVIRACALMMLSPRTVCPMSALGHKQTCAAQNVMSALPPIATAKADIRTRSCLLCPRKRTCAVQLGMSALGQKRTWRHSLDHLVGTREYGRRDCE